MAAEKIEAVCSEVGERIADIRSRADRLSPLDILARMDAIRKAASPHGHDLAEGPGERSGQLALRLR